MTQYNVTPENWDDADFWAQIRADSEDGGLSFSALGALFTVSVTGFGSAAGATLILSNGLKTFSVGPEDADAALGEGFFEDFTFFETSDAGPEIEGLPEDTEQDSPPETEGAADGTQVPLEELEEDKSGIPDSSGLGSPTAAPEEASSLDADPVASSEHAAELPPTGFTTGADSESASPEQAIEDVQHASGPQVVVVDAGIEDAEALAASFGPDVQVILLDPNADGVEQIATALAGQSDIAGLHILAHGAEGHLSLGDTLLTADSSQGEHATALAEIGAALSLDGDILIYGCNFGAGAAGEEAMLALAEATFGDVAASDDLTGAAELGGDWELEAAQGTIETEALEIEGWTHVMSNWYGTSSDDSLSDTSGSYSNVYGYGGADDLFVGSGTVDGGDGNDSIGVNSGGELYGGADDDTLWGFSASVIDGGTGTDTLITTNTAYDISVDLADASSQTYGNGNSAVITGIENITTGAGDDELQGDSSDNIFTAGAGSDTLSGAVGSDTLYGGDDIDTLVGGSGQDSLDGGDGNDRIRGDATWISTYDHASGSGSSTTLTINNESGETIRVYWIDGSGNTSLYGVVSDGGTFTSSTYVNHNWLIADGNGVYREVVEVTGATTITYDAADLGDTIDGGSGSDTIFGESGDDLIDGGEDADVIYGGYGDDTIAIEDNFGDDTVYGESGSGDMLDASALTSGVTVTFTDGEDGTLSDGTDTLTFDNFEEFTLTAYDDSVNGGAADAEMYVLGGAGDDTISGGSDGDTLDGGADDDVLSGGSGDDSLIGGAGNDSLIAGSNSGAGDTLEGGSGNDTLVDSYWNATLDGGDDADFFQLGYGTASVTGGEGGTDADTISFLTANDAVDITLSGGPEAGTYADDDGDSGSFTGIEAFELSNEADTFSSNGVTGTESVYGMGGDDTITTQGGADYIEGGDGADSITAGQDDDTIFGGDGDDYINAQSQSDSVDAGIGNDTVLGGQHNDTIEGGAGADSLDGQTEDDSLSGGAGADTLIGGFGSDTLSGGDDDDTFVATSGDGRDTITDFDISDDDTNGFFNDQLDVSGLTGGTGPAGAIRAQDVVVTDDGSGNAILTFPGGESLLLQGVAPASISGGPNLYAAGIPCFTPCVRIQTARGSVPAADIRVGDMVQTADNGYQPVIWRGQRHLNASDLAAHPHLCPVLVQPGSLLGNETPILVSPQHRFLLPPALVSGEEMFLRATLMPELPWSGVRQARGTRQVTYVHLMTPRHEVIFAEGVATETFFPGPQALQSLSAEDRLELAHLFPELGSRGYGALARADLARRDLRACGLVR